VVADLVLFDTDVLIDAGRGVHEARRALQAARKRGTVALSAVSEMELIVGCRNKRELAALTASLQAFVSVPVDARVSRQAVALLRTYRLSHGLLIPDALIAATALAESIPLVSKNQRDYRFVEALDLKPYPDPFG
jgi:hypothetical protein